jgi:hypothetical protein
LTERKSSYKRLYPSLKWIVSILSIGFFIYQWQEIDIKLFQEMGTTLVHNLGLTTVIFFLALINWNAEAFKLKLLLASEVKLSQLRSFLIILGGMAVSNFTPARTGEYIGRGLLLKSVHPIKVIIATITGNLAQVLFTYGFGLIALISAIMFTDLGEDILSSDGHVLTAIIMLVLLVILIVFGKKIIELIRKILPPKIRQVLSIVRNYNGQLFGKVAFTAGVRYAAFSIQFYLLLQMFSGFALPISSLALIPVAYLMQTLVPVPAVSDVGVRVAVSQILFSAYLSDQSILLAVTCLWFLNLILPGLLGTFHLVISTVKKR